MKYHLGATGTHHGDTGETITVTVAPNPSHLEFVNPVVEGMVRAKQDAMGDREHARVLPVLLHGDAAFAGQGVVAETMHLSGLHGYRTGGTIHVVVNNQIGFTTLPEDARSSTYATDVAKMVHAPTFHVNGDDPEAVAYVAGLALEYRQKFRKDVVIDLVCYRRWGHNETDEPSYTQPLMYAKIKTHPSAATLYGEKLVREGVVTREELETVWAGKKAEMQSAKEGDGTPFVAIARRAPVDPAPVDASAMWGRLKTVLRALGTLPDGLEIHPKLLPFVRKRAELLDGKGEVDWATGESLAWGTLLLEGVPVRLSGQDSGRGTFSQRHAVLHDVRTQKEYVPLNAVAPSGVRFEVYDSLLSEAAVLGFEYGYSVAEHRDARAVGGAVRRLHERRAGHHRPVPRGLGDEVGPAERARAAAAARPRGPGTRALERAHRALPHALRPRATCAWPTPRRPPRTSTCCACRAATPSRSRSSSSPRRACCATRAASRRSQELAEGRFEPVIDDRGADPARVRRVVLCSGKVYYDLLKAREDRSGTTWRWCASSGSTRSRRRRSRRRSGASRRRPRSSGARRSRATWARGASCASASWTATSRPAGARRATPAARHRPLPRRAR